VQHIGKSKVTKLKAKAGVVYPLIRLPKTYADEIGKVAEIFETQHNDRRALLVTFNEGAGPSEVIRSDSKVIQLSPEVIQLDGFEGIENPLSTLESKIDELKSLICQGASAASADKEKRWARPDSDRRPPPCEDGGFPYF
jgi:hypothetical protein